jgi:hypothetical protein
MGLPVPAAPQDLLVVDQRRAHAGHLVVIALGLQPDPRHLEGLGHAGLGRDGLGGLRP